MNNKKFNQVLSNGRTKLKEILQEMIDEKLFSEQSTKIPEVFELQNNYPNISSAEFLKIVNDYADFYYMWYKDKCEESSVKLLIRHGRMSDHIIFSPYQLSSSIIWNVYCGEVFGVKINVKDESPIYAWVYNIHNGYYAHAIYYTDSSLKVDCFEEDYL